ncbi:protein translocase subunit SecF [Candidatus Wolfebacteria bacterium CG03_land_8_20_14_0_80_40_12]|uniref:Protein-export membrane protein SecF n=1 Tax=Candidatus Wolfebacteria bacterium CG03_land_8_20_14_0_80_40_12 TaxID=1975069 RepID=A0A2M7B5F4_9BACT|nr:MAG: protein translocase subunit SecF [Candidatus Wolfebacteria bacterium CG03_land_8_20_14_0_80_40_12]
MNIIGHRKIFLSISGILVLASVAAIVVFGFRSGIDFAGGTLWQIAITRTDAGLAQINAEEIKKFFETDLGIKNITVFPAENNSFLIRLPHISEDEHQNYSGALKTKFVPRYGAEMEELRYETIGPSIGKELKKKAFWSVILVLLGISLYIAYAFRKVSYPVKSWKYGIITLITLFHDITIPTGMIAILGWSSGIEIDTNFVVALLVVMGFSVHDTIVVFDRIRENILLESHHSKLSTIVNNSVNQTIARSINTSLTLVLILLALFFFGPITLKYFILTILAGTIIGTYSSIFVASPALIISNKDK